MAMVSGEFGALLTMEMEPEALPPEVGANCAVKEALWPAAILSGVEIPLIVKPVPDAEACEMVSEAEPPLVKVTVCEPLLPTATEPKVTFDGLAETCGVVPVPLMAMVSGEFGALLTMEMVPEALPPVVGANWAVKEVDCPAPRLSGVEIPVMVKPEPEAVACEMVNEAEPPLVKVTVCEPLLPTATEPKVTFDGLAPSWACVPVPVSATEAGEPGALLTIEMEPVALPADVGANVAVKDAVEPGAIFNGVPAPLTLKPVPEAEI